MRSQQRCSGREELQLPLTGQCRTGRNSTQGRSSRKDYTCDSTWGFTTRKMFKEKPDVSQTPHHVVCRFFSSFQSWVLTSCLFLLHVCLSMFRYCFSRLISGIIYLSCVAVPALLAHVLWLLSPVPWFPSCVHFPWLLLCTCSAVIPSSLVIVFLHHGISFPFTSIFLQVGS